MSFTDWLNWRVLAGALAIGLVLTCLALWVLLGLRQAGASTMPPTAILEIIPAPTFTLPITTPAQGSPDLTPAVPPSPVPGLISLNAYVQITGTDGIGLRLRKEPGLTSAVQLIGSESEIFIVKDGPREVDGYTWWYLVGPFDESRVGWAVANYLIPVQGP